MRLALTIALLATSCAATADDAQPARPTAAADATQGADGESAPPARPEVVELAEEDTIIGRTNITAAGNRSLDASVDLAAPPIEIDLDFVPSWVVAVEASDEQPVEWVVVSTEGEAVAVSADGSVAAIPSDGSTQQPVVVQNEKGDLRVISLNSLTDSALPNATLVEGRNGVRAWLDGPTDRYVHGSLDDDFEASELVIEQRTVIDPMDEPGAQRVGEERTVVTLTDTVAEGLAPLLADLDGDGTQEVLITESNAEVGARLVAYRLDGTVLARSEPIGRGNRWRHQIAVAPTGPAGETEILEVQTPHLSGTAQFLRLVGDQLVVQTSRDGYGSHALRSANLDMAMALDADGNGTVDLVAPTKDRSALAVLTRIDDDGSASVSEELLIPLPYSLATNVAAASSSDGTARFAAAVAAADRGGTLLVWS